MKNIYFGIAFVAILAFVACSDSDDNEPDNSEPSSSSGQIFHISSACYVTANGYSLCWENEKMTDEKCAGITEKYRTMGAETYDFREFCPDEGITSKCTSETGEVNAYIYGHAVPTCQMIAKLKIDEY